MYSEYENKEGYVVEDLTTIDSDYKNQPLYTVEDFSNRFAKMLGQRFGVEDIRNVKP